MTGPVRFCPNCGTPQTRADARFCQSCGRPLPQRPMPPAGAPTPSLMPAPRNHRLLGVLLIVALLLALAIVLALPPTRSAILALVIPQPTQPSSSAGQSPATTQAPERTPPVVTQTAAPEPISTATPPDTAIPVVTATPEPTSTERPSPTPSAPQATVLQAVNLRTGPGQDFDVIRLLSANESLMATARAQTGDWIKVETVDAVVGWVFALYTDIGDGAFAALPVVTPSSLPPCSIAVDSSHAAAYSRSRLGCPLNSTRIIWAAWEPFERGGMLWRNDRNQVAVFYEGDGWTTLPDRWDQVSSAPGRGAPPSGRQIPIRGFGWIWGTRDDVFRGLGWATGEEKGLCIMIQDFERGFVFAKSSAASCTDRNGQTNFSRAAEVGSLFIAAYDNGEGWQRY